MTIGMWYIRYRYARCSRDLKRLESTTRSPVYSYLASTLHGLKVIRSYHAEKICLAEFHGYLDDNTRANYLSVTTNRWAAVRFDWTTFFFITFVISTGLIVRINGQQFSAADIAISLSYSFTLMGLLQWTIRYVRCLFSSLLYRGTCHFRILQTIRRGRDTDDWRGKNA